MTISGSVSSDAERVRRCTITIPGVVQGVGFRPFVYRMARRHGLTGSVRNSLQGALAELEGREAALERFLDQLQSSASNAGRYARCQVTWGEPSGVSTLSIEESLRNGTADLHPAPDLGICDACLGELFDGRDRRGGYPLIT
jgi:hydrogenase maturation protein HypF